MKFSIILPGLNYLQLVSKDTDMAISKQGTWLKMMEYMILFFLISTKLWILS